MKYKLFYKIMILIILIFFLNINNASAANTTFSISEVTNASSSVQTYVETNHKLPNNITISGTTVNMAEFLKLECIAIENINNNKTTKIALENYNKAIDPSETITNTGNLTKSNYLILTRNVISYMNSNGRAPNYQIINSGNIRYENLVYTFAEILNSYGTYQILPDFVTVRPWNVIKNSNTIFITMKQIDNGAKTVQSYVEHNHQLPNNVTISGRQITMPQFLKLEITYLININGNLYASIILKNYNMPPDPYESITGGNLEYNDYIKAANDIISSMDDNGRAPNGITTIRGTMRYETLVYTYAELLNSINQIGHLPAYITLTPWNNVIKDDTVFLPMDQIKTVAYTVKSYIETNHRLPEYVTIMERQITMPQFLKLEITSLLNIKNGLFISIVLKEYDLPNKPSETIKSGKINYEHYFNIAENIKSYMNNNGRAPDYSPTNLGNMRYESLIYMYSQLIYYYNANKALPEHITINPWTVVKNPNTKIYNFSQIIKAAQTVETYIDSHKHLPSNVTISGTTINMAQFLQLAALETMKINEGTYGSIILENYDVPTSTSETIDCVKLDGDEYLILANDLINFMYGNGRAPNYLTINRGNIRYHSLVYMYAQILSSYKTNNDTLPKFIWVTPYKVLTNANNKIYSLKDIETAAKSVKSYVENNHKLPSSVPINGTSITMPNFLKLITTAVTNIDGKLSSKIILKDYSTPPSPSETNTGGILSSTDYLQLAKEIITFMDTNERAPNYKTTSIGNIRYESLIFMFSQILDYYSNKEKLPKNLSVDKWSLISNVKKPFFTLEQIKIGSVKLQNYIETNHKLPSSIKISETYVTMARYLQLASMAIQNMNKNLLTSFILGTYSEPLSPSEKITDQTFSKTDYLSLTNDLIDFMYANERAPDYRTTSNGKIQYQTMIYMCSQILNSNNSTKTLPKSITLTPWITVSNTNTVFFTLEQIKTASETTKNYIETNHQLPESITISGQQVTMAQFLYLSAKSVINIENYLKTSVVLETVKEPENPSEDITIGNMYSAEFIEISKKVLSYMESHNKTAPPNITEISLGNTMRYESLIYMFSKILISDNSSENTPDKVEIIPWLALSNPNGTFNFRNQKVFNNIQAAVDDSDTINGDTIWLNNKIYSENIYINKKVIIRPLPDLDIIVQALNPTLPVFTININGSGSTIRELIIKGSTENAGIYIINANNNYIIGNKINNNENGIYLDNSSENFISGNIISENTSNGININLGSDNTISNNEIHDNGISGIEINNSNDNGIYSNNIYRNINGIHLNNSSPEINYNRIAENIYGLINEGNGTVNATNNWWGSNNPIISTTNPCDIFTIVETVTYDPWMILTLRSSIDRSNRNVDYYNHIITADITHNNQGNDTSTNGTLPDDIPVYFNSTLGNINTSSTIKKGKTELKLSCTQLGAADITANLDNQNIHQNANMISTNELGVYNLRTQKYFSDIQKAIDDVDTVNGDIITLSEGIYIENVVIDKKITLKPADGENVILTEENPDKSVIEININGSGSTIEGFKIISSSDSCGISLKHAFNVRINNNTISNGRIGVDLYQSGNNILTNNIIKTNYYGIALYKSTSNLISNGSIKENENGIYLLESNNNLINEIILADNWYGIYNYHSSNNYITKNTIENNFVGIYQYETNYNRIHKNKLFNNGVGITDNSNTTTMTDNTYSENWLSNISIIHNDQMVMASTSFACGPAALGTILKNIGIISTEPEIADLAGTDETGTNLLGLKNAAINLGASSVICAKLSTEQLKPYYLVVLLINENYHYEVVQQITDSTIYLIDPNLGTIEMSLERFNELYTGIALIINDNVPTGVIKLNDAEMDNIQAKGWILYHYYQPGYYYVAYEWLDFGGFWVTYPYWDWNAWQIRLASYYVDFGGTWIPVLRYVPGYWVSYYRWVPDNVPEKSSYITVNANTIVVANSSDIRDSSTFNPNNVYPEDGKSYKLNPDKLKANIVGVGSMVLGCLFAGPAGALSGWYILDQSFDTQMWIPID